jgi:hypothetical protein
MWSSALARQCATGAREIKAKWFARYMRGYEPGYMPDRVIHRAVIECDEEVKRYLNIK